MDYFVVRKKKKGLNRKVERIKKRKKAVAKLSLSSPWIGSLWPPYPRAPCSSWSS
jgi:hypothetical protein